MENKPSSRPCLSPCVDGQQPVLHLIPKHLCNVFTEPQREAIFIRTVSKDRCPEGLCKMEKRKKEHRLAVWNHYMHFYHLDEVIPKFILAKHEIIIITGHKKPGSLLTGRID